MIKSLYKFCVNDKNVYFFNMKELKVAVVCNEPHPEFYIKSVEHEIKELNFVPYFEVEDLTPIEEYEILTKKLNKSGINAYFLNILDDINILIQDIKKNKPDVIFNFVEIYKENSALEMNVVGLLELLNIPYTGAPPMALANCQSKVFAKRLLSSIGIPTPRFTVFKKPAVKYNHNLKFPLMVKPAFEDASVGIENESIVQNNRKLKERIDYVFRNFVQPALVEEFINGRELNVAILGDANPKALPISEITFDEMPDHLYNIVSYQAKWDPHHESYHKTIPACPAKLPKGIETKAKQIALNSFKFMGCRDYARVDMRLSKDNELYVLEVNPNPDLTEGAGFMRSMEAAGYSYVRSLKKIIELASKRGRRNLNYHHTRN
ncbi:MAG: ATP-grasp domain-containing protein [Ignavibacteriaceae bacterium]